MLRTSRTPAAISSPRASLRLATRHPPPVIPANAGIHCNSMHPAAVGPGVRRGDTLADAKRGVDRGSLRSKRPSCSWGPCEPSSSAEQSPLGRPASGVAFLLVPFLWRSKRKLLPCRGHIPARPHAVNNRPDKATKQKKEKADPAKGRPISFQPKRKNQPAANGCGVDPFLATTSAAVGEPVTARLIDSLTAW